MNPNYSDDLDYLLALIYFLGLSETGTFQPPRHLAGNLTLDPARVARVLDSYPGIFRKSKDKDPGAKEVAYSLQARFTQFKWTPGVKEPSGIHPLDIAKVQLVLDFIGKAAEREQALVVSRRTNWIAAGAAIFSSMVALVGVIYATI